MVRAVSAESSVRVAMSDDLFELHGVLEMECKVSQEPCFVDSGGVGRFTAA
jgi:hypothetical protein